MSRHPVGSIDPTARKATEAASQWLVRRDAGAMSADEHDAFGAWLAASPRNAAAYARVEGMWTAFDDSAGSPEITSLRAEALATSRTRLRWQRIAAAVAVIACVPIAAMLVRSHLRSGASTSLPQSQSTATEHFATTRSERSAMTLSDGSIVSLSIDSAMDASFTESERRIVLRRGEAFFSVASNPKRPFVVQAGDRLVSALGTQFDVRLEGQRVEVVLLEGKVFVDSTRGQGAHVELRPDQRLIGSPGATVVADADAQKLTSWRQGWLIFEDESLADAVAQFNRYSPPPVLVPDRAAGSLRISGVFRIGNPGSFAAALQELLPVSSAHDSTGTILLQPVPTDLVNSSR